jgi:uncharacterized protein (TIGR00730 family)
LKDVAKKPVKSYNNPGFMNSPEARPVRILSEYEHPRTRMKQFGISDTIVFFGSARTRPDSEWYKAAHQLAFRLTKWTEALHEKGKRFVICTGGGPGIMEAANGGAAEAGGVTMGMSISLPHEEGVNRFVTPDLGIHFHYFFMRKFWLVYTAKAVVVFPGGFGTLDEFFEVLTLKQTRRMSKPLPIVLFGSSYWNEVINFDALVRHGTINAEDVNAFHPSDSVDEAYEWIIARLCEDAINRPGAVL